MAEQQKASWIQWVALTTTVLAVCAAIASLKASSYSTKVQLATTKEANQWGYYQAKSIKEHSYAINRDILASIRQAEAKNPRLQHFLAAKIKEYDDEIGRYDREKKQIKAEAEKIIQEQEVFKKKNGDFALSAMLLQIAIMSSAVAALIRKKLTWFIGLGLGAWGVFYLVTGLLLK